MKLSSSIVEFLLNLNLNESEVCMYVDGEMLICNSLMVIRLKYRVIFKHAFFYRMNVI